MSEGGLREILDSVTIFLVSELLQLIVGFLARDTAYRGTRNSRASELVMLAKADDLAGYARKGSFEATSGGFGRWKNSRVPSNNSSIKGLAG